MNLKYSYSDIERIIERAIECAEYYEREYLNTKTFTLYLANGEKIKYTINPANVPHLLGIDIYALRGIINLRNDSLLSMLKELYESSYELYNKFKIGLLKQEDVFSDYIDEKLKYFKYNIKLDVPTNLQETEFVCLYKSEKSWEITTKNQKYDYIIVKKLSNDKTALLCLRKSDNKYYVVSSQISETQEKTDKILSELITNQEITLLTGMEVYNTYNGSKYNRNLLPSEKINKLHIMKSYKDKFNCHIDIADDYEYSVERLGDNKEEKYENRNTIDNIITAIINQKLIQTDQYKDSVLLGIINAWNDHVCKSGSKVSEEVKISYTTAINELTRFKQLVMSLEAENRRLQCEVSNLTNENTSLKQENINQKETIDKVYEIIKPRVM